jgi:hypothetical protein
MCWGSCSALIFQYTPATAHSSPSHSLDGHHCGVLVAVVRVASSTKRVHNVRHARLVCTAGAVLILC